VNPSVPESFAQPYRIICVVAAIVCLFYFFSGRRIMADTPYTDMAAMRKRADENPAEIFKTGKTWFFMLAGFLYFTFQLGIMLWLPTYAIRQVDADFHTAELMLTLYFAGSLPMRFLGPLFLKRIKAHKLFIVFGWTAAALMLAALLSENILAMLVLITAVGFMQGSNVAALILMCTDAFPDRTASAASIASLTGGAASLTAPLWMAGMSEYTGFQPPMMIVCGAMFASGLVVLKLGKK
jgi:fucose permease